MLADRDAGNAIIDGRRSGADYLAYWLEIAKAQLRPRVWTRSDEWVRLHQLPSIGRRKVAQLGPVHFQQP